MNTDCHGHRQSGKAARDRAVAGRLEHRSWRRRLWRSAGRGNRPDFVDNALQKARHAAASPACRRSPTTPGWSSARWAAPGIYSARYAGPGARDEDNVDKLLRELSGAESRALLPLRGRFRRRRMIRAARGRGSWHGPISQERVARAASATIPCFSTRSGLQLGRDERTSKRTPSHRGKAIRRLAAIGKLLASGLRRGDDRAAAAGAVRAPALVRSQVPILRLQLHTRFGQTLARRLRCARWPDDSRRESGTRTGGIDEHLHRRRHTQPVQPATDRGRFSTPCAARLAVGTARDHDGGQSGYALSDGNLRLTARPASRGCRSACRVSRRRCSERLGRIHGPDEVTAAYGKRARRASPASIST